MVLVPDNVYSTDSLQLRKTLSAYSSKVFSVMGFSIAPPSPGNTRGLICFPALAFHEVTVKEDMLGSCDGRTCQDCHLMIDKQCTIRKKRNINIQGGYLQTCIGFCRRRRSTE